ncbi:hydroxymethylbilane synthase [Eubacterium sp. 1001713B170207_170306_E7]|uniref:hydroxymethylbilane synthase n=1 Tax=Eubacterium sp. 1001713B170207_170306_E7 TaxID=2787097 RepID=UPI00189C49CC|nr:hydroxymethylbilane synthase [Eubacterium sp. 1001713B170207_170306_E7]
MKIIVGSRGSKLAVVQTNWLLEELRKANPAVDFELRIIKTKGDKIQHKALDKIGDKGIFTKELEDALISGKIDMAVHSMKDMPSALPEGLILSVPPMREDPRDVLLTPHKIKSVQELPQNAVIGTGSKRRIYQLKSIRKDFEVVGIRGNIDTRIRKMQEQKLDGIILAAAGLKRIGAYESADYTCVPLDPCQFVSAPAQGILAVEIREDNETVKGLMETVSNPVTKAQMTAERQFLISLNGSCHIPIGAYCDVEDEKLTLYGLFGNEDGTILYKGQTEGTLGEEADMGDRLAKELKAMVEAEIKPGTVYLAGGGCGDKGLITVKAMEKLKTCDAVVYDALVNEEFLKWTRPECEKIYVGKRAANHALPQDEINALLIRLGKEGKNVVRLKGGDPYVFGRGGEEGEELYDAGVPFEVIPGITSVIGGLAYAGIPITHRDCVSSFQVVTGHLKSEESELDWPVLAKSKGTIVFLMGVKNLEKITAELMKNGMDKNTPAAVVHRASTPYQRVVEGTLETIYGIASEAKITAPSLIVVGDVVTKREKLRFFDSKPLFGKNIVVTRSREQSSKMVEQITELGGNAIEYPTIKIEPIPENVTALAENFGSLDAYSHIIFTSTNGVEIFFDALKASGRDTRALGSIHVTAIGSATAALLAEQGITADFVPKKYVGEELVDGLMPLLTEASRVLIPRSKNARIYVVEELRRVCPVDEFQIYETVREDNTDVDVAEMLKNKEIDYITFTSSTTVQYFVEKIGDENVEYTKNAKCVSIGPVTSDKMRELGLTVDVQAEVYTIAGMIEAILNMEK